MSSATCQHRSVPEGYGAVALSVDATAEACTTVGLAICVLVRDEPDAAGGRFVAIESHDNARALLGCTLDHRGTVHEWLEIWFECQSNREDESGAANESRRRDGLAGLRSRLSGSIDTLWSDAPAPELALEHDQLRAAASLEQSAPSATVVNPGGGCVAVRRYSPIRLGAYVDLLGGAAFDGVHHGKQPLAIDGGLRDLSQSSTRQRLADGMLLSARDGRSSQLAEVLCLKLRALADAVDATAAATEASNCPLLNLDADAFRVELVEPGRGLPALWSTRITLARPGSAVPIAIEGSDHHLFTTHNADPSIYRARSGEGGRRGNGVLRIRDVRQDGDAIIVESTLETDEALHASVRDIIAVETEVAGARVVLYGHVDPDEAMRGGEVRFRTLSRRYPAAISTGLKALAGVPVDRAGIRVLPFLSSVFDMYSLGVLAVRTLLSGGSQTLPIALDAVQSFKKLLDQEAASAAAQPLPGRIAALLSGDDPRWLERLGPQHLIADTELAAAEAMNQVPGMLWSEVLAWVMQMFPGHPGTSFARDFADAPAAAQHRVFAPAQDQMSALLRRTMSLIVVDWTANREIASLIRKLQLTA